MSTPSAHSPTATSSFPLAPNTISGWAFYFGFAYAMQGLAQYGTLLNQPVQYAFKQQGYGADKLAELSFIINLAWYLKPIYGFIADFIPFLGYRRRSYLLLISLIATGLFTWMAGVKEPDVLITLLILTSFSTAICDVLVDGLMIQEGQKVKKIQLYQGLQWACISLITIFTSWYGGQLAQMAKEAGDPTLGYRRGALICIAGPVLMLLATWFWAKEKPSKLNTQAIQETGRNLTIALKHKTLWTTTAFICLFVFQPGLVTPLYVHCTKKLDISEKAYGAAGVWAPIGYVVGVAFFTLILNRFYHLKHQAIIAVFLYASMTLLGLMIQDAKTLSIFNFFISFGWMVSNLVMLSAAALACPKKVEALVFAGIIGLLNLSKQYSEMLGGKLYEGVLDGWMVPLILISAGSTLVCLPLVAFLPQTSTQTTATSQT